MVGSLRLVLALSAALAAHSAIAETVLLDFMSPSCGPCRAMRPVMRQLIAVGYSVREVDASVEPGAGVAMRYRVTDLPTFVVLVDGQERARLVGGGNSAAKIAEMMQTATRIAAAEQARTQTAAPPVFTDHAASGDAAPPADAAQPGRIVTIDPQPPVARTSPRGPSPAAPGAAELVAATVRLSIEDPEGKSTGTGTIIDAREGKALVLTCGHLFRESGGKAAIEVALFTPGPAGAELRTTVEGTLIDYDLERDLALVCFEPDDGIAVAPVARSAAAAELGASATSVGCEHGANPTPWATRITAIDRYQGSPNIEAAGAPVEGRSGGGLFNDRGELVGVCNAADPQRDEGLYASLPSIYAKLDALKLTFVYQTPSRGEARESQGAAAAQLAAADAPLEVRGQNPGPESSPPFAAAAPAALAAAAAPAANLALPAAAPAAEPAAPLAPQDQALLEEIASRGADAEVICIIRSREPGGRSEVIKLDRASPALVRALGGSPSVPRTAAAAAGDAGATLTR